MHKNLKLYLIHILLLQITLSRYLTKYFYENYSIGIWMFYVKLGIKATFYVCYVCTCI